jgi:hypothetical protein
MLNAHKPSKHNGAGDRASSTELAQNDMRPERPHYRFIGTLPVALAHLRDKPRWIAWDYRLINNRWTKPPFGPRTGRNASVGDPNLADWRGMRWLTH